MVYHIKHVESRLFCPEGQQQYQKMVIAHITVLIPLFRAGVLRCVYRRFHYHINGTSSFINLQEEMALGILILIGVRHTPFCTWDLVKIQYSIVIIFIIVYFVLMFALPRFISAC